MMKKLGTQKLSLFLVFSAAALSQLGVTPLHKKSTKEILKNYTIPADFAIKLEKRKNSDELFWKYPFTVAKPTMPYHSEFTDQDKEMPKTLGDGPPYFHLNKGRVLFLKGDLQGARNTWLTNRARYKKNYPYHRRNDYFVGVTILRQAVEMEKENFLNPGKHPAIETYFANAATFLSYAYMAQGLDSDSAADYAAPKHFYNMAAIYFNHKRYAAAYGAATKGMNFLKFFARDEFKSELRRIKSEAHIENRDYLAAVQELDLGISQSTDPVVSAAMLARVADIFFDLNNYEIASDMYGLSTKIDKDQKLINPSQFIYRAESMFWLGKFEESLKLLEFALANIYHRFSSGVISENDYAWAKLRIADNYLALKKYDKAKIKYFQVETELRGTEVEKIAKVRRACLELPEYQGNNIKHARNLLEGMKKEGLPYEATELSWACQVASYAQHERSRDMMERVSLFLKNFPESRFLKGLVKPVFEYQSSRFEEFFSKGEKVGLAYFEQTRDTLYKKLSDARRKKLFDSYVRTGQSKKAKEFWDGKIKTDDANEQLMVASFIAELHDDKGFTKKNKKLAALIEKTPLKVSATKKNHEYVTRVKHSPAVAIHENWIYDLVYNWVKSDDDLTCDLYYPSISYLVEQNKESKKIEKVRGDLTALIDKNGEEIFKKNPSCLMSLLELEKIINEDRAEMLGSSYLKRKSWTLSRELTSLYWSVAELNYQSGGKELGKMLLQHIIDNAPEGAPEVKFAKMRFDTKKTELENIWE